MQKFLKQPVTSADQAGKFLHQLIANDLLFHPSDDALEVVDLSGNHVFTTEEAMEANARMEECWNHMDDPCDYILKVVYQDNN